MKILNYSKFVLSDLDLFGLFIFQTRLQSSTKLKKILQESKEIVSEADVRSRMQPLKDMLIETINHLHTVLETRVFIATCRGYWDRMGQVCCLTSDLII